MAGINKAIIIGRVGKDPEVNYTPSGHAVAKFSVATSEKYKDSSGNTIENTEWHNIVAWRKLAEIIGQYVHKGDMIYIEGKLKTESWEKDGVKHYRTNIEAKDVQFLGGKKQEQGQAGQGSNGPIPDDDDIPF